MGDSSERLWSLIAERVRASDTTDIDRQIWDELGAERAIMYTDLSGFSRQVARFGILHFLQLIYEQEQVLVPVARRFGGRHLKTEADSMLLVFPDARSAVTAAVEMQRTCAATNADRAEEDRIILCVGIGHGKLLLVDDDEVYGHEVNLASKLGEDTARDHEILVTLAARAAAGDVEGVRWVELERAYAGETRCWRVDY